MPRNVDTWDPVKVAEGAMSRVCAHVPGEDYQLTLERTQVFLGAFLETAAKRLAFAATEDLRGKVSGLRAVANEHYHGGEDELRQQLNDALDEILGEGCG